MTTEIITMKSWWFLKFIKQRTVKDGESLTFGTRMRHPALGKRVIDIKFVVASSRQTTVLEIDPRPILPEQKFTLTQEQPDFVLPGALTISHVSQRLSDRPPRR